MEKFSPDPLFGKYGKIDREGRKAFSAKEISGADWSPEIMRNRFHTAITFNPESIDKVREKIIQPMLDIEKELGMKMSIAIRDFTLHSTLDSGDVSPADESKRQEMFDAMTSNETILEYQKKLKDVVIDYRYLIVNKKGQALLVSTDLPSIITDYRKAIELVFSEKGFEYAPVDILHITLTREEEFDLESDPEKAKKIKDFYIKLRHQISHTPFQLTVDNLYTGKCL